MTAGGVVLLVVLLLGISWCAFNVGAQAGFGLGLNKGMQEIRHLVRLVSNPLEDKVLSVLITRRQREIAHPGLIGQPDAENTRAGDDFLNPGDKG